MRFDSPWCVLVSGLLGCASTAGGAPGGADSGQLVDGAREPPTGDGGGHNPSADAGHRPSATDGGVDGVGGPMREAGGTDVVATGRDAGGGTRDSGQGTGSDAGGGEAAAPAPICGDMSPGSPLVNSFADGGAVQATVTWYGACWYYGTIYGITGNFQSVDLAATTSGPVPLEGTLFYTSNCDPSQGTDNLNDFGTPLNTADGVQGFTHHPDFIPSSAVYWLGDEMADGMCQPGAPCSGCVTYDLNTPCCGSLP